MTNDLPDALIVKLAAWHCNRQAEGIKREGGAASCWDELMPITKYKYMEWAYDALTALDISGIISDLRFYGNPNTWRIYDSDIMTDFEDDKGQRARTRLSLLMGEK